MLKTGSLAGIWVATMTPFGADGGVDVARLVRYGTTLLAKGVTGLSLFGTTGEGTSLSLAERQATLAAVVAAGVPAARIIPGTAATDVATTLEVARHAGALGCPALLALPPFFMKGMSEAGIRAHYTRVIEGLKGITNAPRLMLYNIPEHSGVTILPETMRRLADAHPGHIVGVKDSSGSLASAKAFLAAGPDLDILVGDEHLLDFMQANGGAGLLCGMANLVPDLIVAAWREGDAKRRAALQAQIDAAIAALDGFSILPAIKAGFAGLAHDDAWRAMRAPFEAVAPEGAALLARRLAAVAAVTGVGTRTRAAAE